MPDSFEPETLAKLVRAYVDANPVSLRFAPVSTGKHNTSYWVNGDRSRGDPGRWVMRIAPPDDAGFLFYERLMMRQEPELHALIRAQTTMLVAEIVGYDFRKYMPIRVWRRQDPVSAARYKRQCLALAAPLLP